MSVVSDSSEALRVSSSGCKFRSKARARDQRHFWQTPGLLGCLPHPRQRSGDVPLPSEMELRFLYVYTFYSNAGLGLRASTGNCRVPWSRA